MSDQYRESFIGRTSKFLCLHPEMFCVCMCVCVCVCVCHEHGMSCALEINSNGKFKQGHAESFPLTKKKHLLYHNACGHQTSQCGDLP